MRVHEQLYVCSRTPESYGPTTAWRKQEIKEWLLARGLDVQDNMTKGELLEKARQNPVQVQYLTDVIAARQPGLSVLRLPPYHPEMNPIELIQGQEKNYVRSTAKHNVQVA